MYTIIDRRRLDLARFDETSERGQREYFPKLQAADGFIGFYLVADGDLFTGIIVWEDKAKADAFEPTAREWLKTLEEMGHRLESENRGETVMQLEPKK